ncbi:hypothetical protein ACFL96_15225, partial [Thermoproteota archaeon]
MFKRSKLMDLLSIDVLLFIRKTFLKNNCRILLFISALLLSLNIPYWFRGLSGEDGIFTMIAYYPWRVPYVGIIGREDMILKFSQYGHPVFPYYLLRFVGFFIQRTLSLLGLNHNPITLVFLLRATLSVFNLSAVILLLSFCFKREVHKNNSLLFFGFSLSWLTSIYFCLSSSNLQYETASFSFITLSLFLVLNQDRIFDTFKSKFLLIFFGFVMGIGKNEWSLISAFGCLCIF